MLWVAERHLRFILQVPPVGKKSNLYPIFYLTNTKQGYSQIIDLIPDLPEKSVFHSYYGWTEYFSAMKRSGIQVDCDHIGVISLVGYAREYWQRAHDFVLNIKGDIFTPKPFYWLRSSDTSCGLRIFFLSSSNMASFLQAFSDSNINPHIQFFDKSSIIKNQDGNVIYSNLANIYCEMPREKMDKITALLDLHEIRHEGGMFLPKLDKIPNVAELIYINLNISRNTADFMRISLICETEMWFVLRTLQNCLGIEPSSREKNALTYKHDFKGDGTYFEALESVSQFLAKFMSLLSDCCSRVTSFNEYNGLRFFGVDQLKCKKQNTNPQYQFIKNDSLILVNASQEYHEEMKQLVSKLDPERPVAPAEHYESPKKPCTFFHWGPGNDELKGYQSFIRSEQRRKGCLM